MEVVQEESIGVMIVIFTAELCTGSELSWNTVLHTMEIRGVAPKLCGKRPDLLFVQYGIPNNEHIIMVFQNMKVPTENAVIREINSYCSLCSACSELLDPTLPLISYFDAFGNISFVIVGLVSAIHFIEHWRTHGHALIVKVSRFATESHSILRVHPSKSGTGTTQIVYISKMLHNVIHSSENVSKISRPSAAEFTVPRSVARNEAGDSV